MDLTHGRIRQMLILRSQIFKYHGHFHLQFKAYLHLTFACASAFDAKNGNGYKCEVFTLNASIFKNGIKDQSLKTQTQTLRVNQALNFTKLNAKWVFLLKSDIISKTGVSVTHPKKVNDILFLKIWREFLCTRFWACATLERASGSNLRTKINSLNEWNTSWSHRRFYGCCQYHCRWNSYPTFFCLLVETTVLHAPSVLFYTLQSAKQKDHIAVMRVLPTIAHCDTEVVYQDTFLHLLIAYVSSMPDHFTNGWFPFHCCGYLYHGKFSKL